jgi:hypothetical protein
MKVARHVQMNTSVVFQQRVGAVEAVGTVEAVITLLSLLCRCGSA